MKPRPRMIFSISHPRTTIRDTPRSIQRACHRAFICPAASHSTIVAPYSLLTTNSTRKQHNTRHPARTLPSSRQPVSFQRASVRHYASSSSSSRVAAVPAKSSSSGPPLPRALAKLNPPESTYAPPLTIPSQQPGQGKLKYLYQCGKLYIQFYKQGISNVRSTAKLASSLRKRQKAQQANNKHKNKEALPPLTRAEWQITRRSRADVLRLPPFAVLVLLLGEYLPLLALYITPIIPEPCRIPKQVERTLRKADERRTERLRRLALDAARLHARDRQPGKQITSGPAGVRPAGVQPADVDRLGAYELRSLSSMLGVHGGLWDRLFVNPPLPWLRLLVRRRLEYLRMDGRLIERDGGVQGLGHHEVVRACFERGIRVLGVKEEVLRRELAAWFRK